MAEITIDASQVYAKLKLVQDMPRVLAPPTREALTLLKGRMQRYPPEPPGSTYVRTGDLRRGWHYRTVLSGNVLGRVWNEGVGYADYVQSAERQAWMHVGRWQTEMQVADQSQPEILNLFDAYLTQILK